MNWNLAEASYGDVIRVKSGNIFHYGIYVADDEVIQFGKNPANIQDLTAKDVTVISTNISDFILGEFLEVASFDKKELKEKYTADKIVETARRSLGEGGYHILYNNCEHFVNRCVFGKSNSSQVDKVRDFFRNMPVLNVYYSIKPISNKFSKVFPKKRQEEIEKCSNEKVKRDKYYVWKLLEYGLKNTFGYDIKKIEINKNENGKWESPRCFFSLSHSEDIVVVAISNKPIGVDIEMIQTLTSGMENKILNEEELEEFLTISQRDDFLIKKWTQKESLFKMLNEKVFVPKKIQTKNVDTEKIVELNKEYYLSIANENIANKKIIKINL